MGIILGRYSHARCVRIPVTLDKLHYDFVAESGQHSSNLIFNIRVSAEIEELFSLWTDESCITYFGLYSG